MGIRIGVVSERLEIVLNLLIKALVTFIDVCIIKIPMAKHNTDTIVQT